MTRNLATVIMAAGRGTRMKNPNKPKVMFEILGKPMIEHVTTLASSLDASRTIAVVGFKRKSVVEHLKRVSPEIEFAVQEPQMGTGHAVMQTEQLLGNFAGDVLVLSGDVPLLRISTIEGLRDLHRQKNAVATILTAEVDDPGSYGRVIRDEEDHVAEIVEQKDATREQQTIKEINSGIYLFDKEQLFNALHNVTTHNAQHEYYLTDVFDYFSKHRMRVAAKKAEDFNEVRGINTLEQLQAVENILLKRNGLS